MSKRQKVGERVKKLKLPHDMVLEILPRLPVKSLIRFRCVSNEWSALISDPQFIKKHLNRAIKDHDNHGIIVRSTCFVDFLYPLDYKIISDTDDHDHNECVTNTKLNLPLLNTRVYRRRIVGSCHGLICIVDESHWCIVDEPDQRSEEICMFYFFNPSTRELKKILDSRFHAELQDCLFSLSRYGFGYDSSTDDYKLVTQLPYGDDDDNGKSLVTVYSLRANTWRKLENCPSYGGLWNSPGRTTHLNGAIHWLNYHNNSYNIASLDLSDETFEDLPPPNVDNLPLYGLDVFKECLCLVGSMSMVMVANNFEVWVMKEYGVRESWTKFTIRTQDYFLRNLPCRVPMSREPLVLYNQKEEFPKILLLFGGYYPIQAKTYVKSLVSPFLQ